MDNQLIVSVITGLMGIFATISIFLLFLLISRELMSWYFKTNEIIKLLKQIEQKEK